VSDSDSGAGGMWDEEVYAPGNVIDAAGSPPNPETDHCLLTADETGAMRAQWDVRPELLEQVRRELGDGWTGHRKILRVHGTPASASRRLPAPSFSDLDFTEMAGGATIADPLPDRAYRVDVGVLTASRLFYPLVSSNTMVIPRGENQPDEPESETTAAPSIGIAEVPPRFVNVVPAPALFTAGTEHALPPDGGRIPSPPAASSPPAPGSMPAASPAGPVPSPAGRSKFWLTLNTEVVVSGATVPNARVRLQGVEVPLRPDGTFSLRLTLSEGKQVIDANAVSADGLSERIVAQMITRSTTSSELEREEHEGR